MNKLIFSLIKGLYNAVYEYIFTFDKNKSFIKFVDTISRENIFYIKIFQGLGTNTNLFNDEQSEYLKKFLDNVPYDNTDIYQDLHNQLIQVGNKNEEHKIDVDTLKIINSGVIGIVYKGVMNEKDIVVKVIKNNIEEKIYSALQDYKSIINFITYFSLFKFYYIEDIFNSNKDLLINQLDFRNEVENIETFYKNNEHTDYVEVPYVYKEFTKHNNKIIVMDYLEGKKLFDLNNEERSVYLEQIVNFSYKSILFNKNFHCDLHPGNVIFMDNPKRLGVIDYGIIGEISRQQQDFVYNFFNESMKNKNFIEASKIIIMNCTTIVNGNPSSNANNITNENINEYNCIILELSKLIHELIDNKHNLDAHYIYMINKILFKKNLKLAEFFCKIELSFGISDSLCKKLIDNTSLIDVAIKIFQNFDI